jgi:diguanylate cyclase (GGDEF)-like protein
MSGQPLDDPGRLEAIERSGLLGDMSLPALERISRLITRITGAPLALVNVVTDREQASVTGVSALPRFRTDRVVPLTNSFCQHVVTGGAPLVVTDSRADPRLTGNLAVTEDNVIAYLGVPLYAPSGHVIGALCAIDERPREWSSADQRAMDDLGAIIADELALRDAGRRIEELMGELAQQARRDPLTHLGNRRLWEEQAAVELSRARRDGIPLSVILLDLDDFKSVNDERGHAAGDALLKDLAQRWSQIVRLPDLLVRIGGDEFAVLLPNAREEDARAVAERLVAALPDGAGASFGVAQWVAPESIDALMARADDRLYARKRAR